MLDEEARDRAQRWCSELRQGDVIKAYAFSVLGAPESTASDETAEAIEYAEFPVTSVERRNPSGLWAIVTQTCDIRRGPDTEPFLHLAPLREVSESAWHAAEHGKGGPREYAYPPLPSIDFPVLDIRLIQTVEKLVLGSESVDPLALSFDVRARTRLSAWLSRRFARHAFPDPLENALLRPLRTVIKDKREKASEAGAVLRAREAVLISYTATGSVDAKLVLNQAKAAADPVLAGDAARIEAGVEQIFRPVAKALTKSGASYELTWSAAYPHRLVLADVMYRYQPLDVDD